MVDIEYTIVKYVPREIVKCQTKIPSLQLKFLKVGECYLHFVTIKGFENVKLKCFIKKPKVNLIDLTIEKSDEIQINGLFLNKKFVIKKLQNFLRSRRRLHCSRI